MLVRPDGTVKASYGYDGYGNKDTALTNGDASDTKPFNPYRYSAKRWDSGSGSIDMGARRYGPDLSAFLQQDRYNGALDDLGLSLDPLTQNRYSLAGGNPVSFVEVDGHIVMPDGGGGGAKSPRPDEARQASKRARQAMRRYADRQAVSSQARKPSFWDHLRNNLNPFSDGPLDDDDGKQAASSANDFAAGAAARGGQQFLDRSRSGGYVSRLANEVAGETLRLTGKALGAAGASITFATSYSSQLAVDEDETLTSSELHARAGTMALINTVGQSAGGYVGAQAGLAVCAPGGWVAAVCAGVGNAAGGCVGQAAADAAARTLDVPDRIGTPIGESADRLLAWLRRRR